MRLIGQSVRVGASAPAFFSARLFDTSYVSSRAAACAGVALFRGSDPAEALFSGAISGIYTLPDNGRCLEKPFNMESP